MWCLYNDHCLDIFMIIWSSINCPTVIVSHRLLFFSREATSETYGPLVSFHHICLCDLFSLAFIFRSIKPKLQKYLAAIYLFRGLFILSTTIISRYLAYLRRRIRKGLTAPLTRQAVSICSLCAGVVYVEWGGPPTSSITLVSSLREIPTVAILHHPFLFGEIPM